MSLAWIPRGILSIIQIICCRFLCKWKQPGKIFAWDKWESLALPKKWGGWGIKRLENFSTSLAAKLVWKLIILHSCWTKVSTSKYIAPQRLMDWLRQPQWNFVDISIIWKAVLESMSLIQGGLTWRIHSGASVRLWIDPYIKFGNTHRLPDELKTHLIAKGITYISHIANREHSTFAQQAWKSGRALQIPKPWQQQWKEYTDALTESHIRILEGEDEIRWAPAKHGRYTPK